MIEESPVRAAPSLLRLRLGEHLVQAAVDEKLAMLQTAVALMRTLFEDHYVDPEHQSCLFFHGCAIAGAQNETHDFTVRHRSGQVVLSEFTFPWKGPASVTLPLFHYARDVLHFAEQVSHRQRRAATHPAWRRQYADSLRGHLHVLIGLSRRFLAAGCERPAVFREEYHHLHGHLKRPLELQVTAVLEDAGPFQPVTVLSRVLFGPVQARQVTPMRLNRGDVIRVSVLQFTPAGIALTVEGVGSGGVRPGDRLYGLQLFYP